MPYKDFQSARAKETRLAAVKRYNEKNKEKISAAQTQRARKKRAKLVEHMGGKCVKCGTTENLHFDHIDATTKSFGIGNNMNRSMITLKEECKKCQLLCQSCHIVKSKECKDYRGMR